MTAVCCLILCVFLDCGLTLSTGTLGVSVDIDRSPVLVVGVGDKLRDVCLGDSEEGWMLLTELSIPLLGHVEKDWCIGIAVASRIAMVLGPDLCLFWFLGS